MQDSSRYKQVRACEGGNPTHTVASLVAGGRLGGLEAVLLGVLGELVVPVVGQAGNDKGL